MAAPVIEGIDNEVLFVVSVFVALVTILLVHLLYKSNRNSNTRQNESHFSSYSDSASSSRPEDVTQENSREGRKSYFATTLVQIPFYQYSKVSLISILSFVLKALVKIFIDLSSTLDRHLSPHLDRFLVNTRPTLDQHLDLNAIATQSTLDQKPADSWPSVDQLIRINQHSWFCKNLLTLNRLFTVQVDHQAIVSVSVSVT